MDALIAISVIVILVAALSALSTVFGVDSRDGFANDRLRSGLS